MGGLAFARAAAEGQPTLSTPRMLPETYWSFKADYLKRLQEYFPAGTRVATLTEAPEKEDYGDIDFIASFPAL